MVSVYWQTRRIQIKLGLSSLYFYKEGKMKIRLSPAEDIPAIMAIYDVARQFMKDQGNPTQWDGGYPSAGLIEGRHRGWPLLCCRGRRAAGWYLAFIIGEDPTYQGHRKGNLAFCRMPFRLNIHRIASNGQVRGLSRQVFWFCRQQIPTCESIPMRTISLCRLQCWTTALESAALFMADGSPRLAYDYHQ